MNKLFDRNTKAGFTLVELIIVIAILGILAGIAIPVYNGYIKKAHKAADLVLIDSVNTAFAAACAEYGFKPADVDEAALAGSDKITGVDSITLKSGVTTLSARSGDGIVFSNLAASENGVRYAQIASYSVEKFQQSFLKYFGTNVDVKLQYADSVADIEFNNGLFGLKEDAGSTTLSNGWTVTRTTTESGDTLVTYTSKDGKTSLTVNQNDIDALNDSVFGTKFTSETLSGNVAQVADIATGLLENDKGKAYMNNADFQAFVEENLNTTVDEMTAAEKANALVLYAANKSSGMTGADYVDKFGNKAALTLMNINKNDPQYLADAAAGYALLMGFAYSDAGEKYMIGDQTVKEYFESSSKNLAHASDVVTMFQAVDKATLKDGETAIVEGKTGLKGYLETEGEKALDGYVAALNMVDSNIGNFDSTALETLLQQGYASTDVVAILQNVMGK